MNPAATSTRTASIYRTRLATSAEDVAAAQRLRFEVFNLELCEGLVESFNTLRDADRFDEVCDHLLVEHTPTGEVVGTYRLQTGTAAARGHGYYSAQEFDLTPFEPFRAHIVELGRACVKKEHRKMSVLSLLWRGIANYAREHGCRFLIGCSSLTSQDPATGHAALEALAAHLTLPPFQTVPLEAFRLPAAELPAEPPEIPRLLRGYLSAGAKICGPGALDREFGTIDFLTLLDLYDLTPTMRSHFSFE